VIAALQLYSDNSNVNMKGTSAYPVKASLLNIAYGKRIRSFREVALLPNLGALCHELGFHQKGTAKRRITKLCILHKCLSVLLYPLKKQSYKGTLLHIVAFAGSKATEEERALSDELVTLAATWVIACMEHHRKRRSRDITETDFNTMQARLAAFFRAFKSTVAVHTPSGDGIIKMHKLWHAVDAIKRYGSLRHLFPTSMSRHTA